MSNGNFLDQSALIITGSSVDMRGRRGVPLYSSIKPCAPTPRDRARI